MNNQQLKRNGSTTAVFLAVILVLMVTLVSSTAAKENAAELESTTVAKTTAVSKQQGDVGFLTSPNSGTPLDIAQAYLNTNRTDYGLTTADLADTAVIQTYSSQSDFTQIEMHQRVNEIDVFNGIILINIAADGSIINLHNHFIPAAASKVNIARPELSAEEAVYAAADHLGLMPQDLAVEEQIGGASEAVVFNAAGISRNPISAKLIYQPQERAVRLAWDIEIYELDQQNWWSMRVDAVSGEVLAQDNYVIHEDFNAQAAEAHGTSAFDSVEQHQHTAPATTAPELLGSNDYWVYEWPRESPLHNPQGPAGPPAEGRTIQNSPWNDASPSSLPSPYGWHDTNGAAGAEYTVTRGNNVNAYEDGNNPGYQPNCGPSLDCASSPLFDVDFTQSPNSYEAAAITNLYYWNNIIHDMTYLYGFDEAARNFQENNYGNGGAGSDSVNAEAQDGSGNCNANFGTPSDGSNPTMQMYTCSNTSPDRDGDFDNAVIVHEYTHGISNRLTGGSSVFCLNNSEQMGEGWSDWLSMMMTMEAGDLGTDSRGMGTYLFGQPPNGPGIRPNPYSTNFSVNDTTYADISGLPVPHGVGYAWATMLWEMNWELINNGVSTSGLDPDIFNGTGGNNLTTQLVMDGMKLQPCSPGFVDGRDAILLADQNLTGGQNQCVIWDAFARRGLGYSASQGSSGSTSDGTEAFDLPAACQQVLKIDKSASSNPVTAGSILTYNLVATNDTLGTLTSVVMNDTIEAGQTYVGGSATCGGSESGGVVTFPVGTMTAGQVTACSFQVIIDGGLGSTEFFFDDFEDGSFGNWTSTGLWNPETEGDSCGSVHAPFPSSNNAAYFGQSGSCNFNTGSAVTGALSMNNDVALAGGSAPVLNFSYFLETEQFIGYDEAFVEISTNGGSTWSLLLQVTDSGWQAVSTDLSAYAGSNVRIRFRFDSGDSINNNYFGWLVDDVQIIEEVKVSNMACVTAYEGDNDCDSVETLVEPAACSAPNAVTDLIATMNVNGTHIDLAWTGTGADTYQIHRNANGFYFNPTAGNQIGGTSSPSHTDSTPNIIGDPTNNYGYVVVAMNYCEGLSGGGGSASAPSNQVGEFDFSIVAGTP